MLSQSQSGATSITKAMWKFGLPWMTAQVYSAILQDRSSLPASHFVWMASFGHTAMQRPQPRHFSSSITALRSITLTPSCAQFFSQVLQPMQRSSITRGVPPECMICLPLRLPPPMPMFLSTPPKPALMWPFTWLIEMTMSASANAEPILAVLQNTPFGTGISRSSRPRRPSAMMVCTPVASGL